MSTSFARPVSIDDVLDAAARERALAAVQSEPTSGPPGNGAADSPAAQPRLCKKHGLPLRDSWLYAGAMVHQCDGAVCRPRDLVPVKSVKGPRQFAVLNPTRERAALAGDGSVYGRAAHGLVLLGRMVGPVGDRYFLLEHSALKRMAGVVDADLRAQLMSCGVPPVDAAKLVEHRYQDAVPDGLQGSRP